MKIHEVKMSLEHNPGRRLLRPKQVMARMGWSRTTLWRRVRAGAFPAPVELGVNMIGWTEETVEEAIEALPRRTYGSGPDSILSSGPGQEAA